MQPPVPDNEDARLQALNEYQILDTAAKAEFDDFTMLAAHICGTPIALISLLDADQQWFKSKVGFPNVKADVRFAGNTLVIGETDVRFCADAPLVTTDDHALGTPCVIDHAPCTLAAEQERALQALSRQVIARLAMRHQLTDRQKAERDLRAGEALKATILQSALDCVITIDQDGRVMEWNPVAEKTFGRRREEAIGRELAELIVPPALREAHRRGIAHYLATGEGPILGKRIEISAVRSDGSELPVELAIMPILLEGASPVFIVTIRDISERKRTEEALQLAHAEMETRVEQRTAALAEANLALAAEDDERRQIQAQLVHALQERENIMETVPDILFRLDLSGRLTQWNRKLEAVTGLSAEELKDRDAMALFSLEERATVGAAIVQAFVTGYAKVEAHLLALEGVPVPHEFSGVPLRDAAGAVIGLTGMGRDITGSKRQQADFAESEQRYRSLIEHSPEGILVYSDSRIAYLNGAALKLFGAETSQQLLGRSVFDVVHPDWHDEARERARLSQQDREPSSLAEFKYLRMDGSAVEVEAVSTPILFEGKPAGQVLIRDITGRKQAEREIHHLHTELTQAYQRALNAYDATIEGWSRALDYRDHETEGHSRRVTELTMQLAQAIGVGAEELIHVRRGALLHDIGKMAIPDSVLLKPGPLDAAEWEVMRRHPAYAQEMLTPIAFLRPALDIPRCHHEKWDGTGYPEGLRGEQIPLAARLFAVVDVWDALRSDRPYRKAWDRGRTLDHIRGLSGTHFDPQVVGIFLVLMAEGDQHQDQALALAA